MSEAKMHWPLDNGREQIVALVVLGAILYGLSRVEPQDVPRVLEILVEHFV